MKELIMNNLAYLVPILVFGFDFLLRKWPGAKPLFQILDDVLDKTPGFKNKE